jgi:hypothetical protein
MGSGFANNLETPDEGALERLVMKELLLVETL